MWYVNKWLVRLWIRRKDLCLLQIATIVFSFLGCLRLLVFRSNWLYTRRCINHNFKFWIKAARAYLNLNFWHSIKNTNIWNSNPEIFHFVLTGVPAMADFLRPPVDTVQRLLDCAIYDAYCGSCQMEDDISWWLWTVGKGINYMSCFRLVVIGYLSCQYGISICSMR